MELDDKTIMELASQLGISANKKTAAATVKSYEKKSDAELIAEIMKPMMNREQKARLSKIIELLK